MPKIEYVPKRFGQAALEKIDLINDIIEDYASQGFDLTLRQLYYQLVAKDLIPNNLREYKNLGVLVSDARLAGYIDWEMIVDRVRELERLPSWDSPAEIIDSARRSYRMNRWDNQEYRPEVWVEKNAAVGIIGPICRSMDVPFFACIGYTSQTAIWEAAQRLRGYLEEGKTPIIFHLGDHDPSGIDMTRDIRDRLDLFLEHDRREDYQPYDGIEVDRLALNMDQVTQYNPPPNPAKLTDSRATGYIMEFGYDSWELDALSPTAVSNLIEEAVSSLLDQDKLEEIQDKEAEGKKLLEKTVKRWERIVDFLEEE